MKTARPLIFCPRVVCELAPIAAITLWSLVMSHGCNTGSGQNVSELVKDLNDQKADVRVSAARALEGIGPEAKAAVPALSEALKDEDSGVRRAAVGALGRLGPEAKAAVRALIEALKDEDANVRRNAAIALKRIRSDANAAGQSQ